MTPTNFQQLANFIWSVADLLIKGHKDSRIEYEPDPAHKDAENVPLKEDIVSYFLQEGERVTERVRQELDISVRLLKERRAALITAAVIGQLAPEAMAA
ncbi:hypothetical protein [Aromatoleum anaerobium]|uniref:Site-specific DNA-methyltransferase (adenine-specific) n=1 Tax=Aromatoleum anaerobium TaxID=182180 RepID=A0ABX1PNA5_9RHOO|nr:hypothetical protein [Aromatoleum anaerobium]MCK0505892.1 hypothetical protein [Aromatoleum anaerobium]